MEQAERSSILTTDLKQICSEVLLHNLNICLSYFLTTLFPPTPLISPVKKPQGGELWKMERWSEAHGFVK